MTGLEGIDPRPRRVRLSGTCRRNRAVGLLLAAVVATAIVHGTTLTISPPPWQDEIQIVDYGRTAMPFADLTYGVNWSAAGRPVQGPSYIACLIQEIAYQCAGGTMAGPRFSALAGASLAAVFMVAWLRAAGIGPWIAFACGCCFLWDPLFIQGYRGARVDGWCMAFMLAALWCVRRATAERGGRTWLVGAGALVALSGLAWPSAILLLPLLVHEIVIGCTAPTSGQACSSDPAVATRPGRMAVVGVSAAIVMTLLLLPMWVSIRNMVHDLSAGISHVSAHKTSRFLSNCLLLPTFFERSPLVPLVALTAAVVATHRSWFLPFLVAAAGVVATQPYTHRAIYLMPYFVYGVALFAHDVWQKRDGWPRKAALVPWIAALLMLWSGGVGLVARTLVAVWEKARRDPALVERLVDDITQGRKGRVLLGAWNLYYPFRSRGWDYWGPCDGRSPEEIARTLDYDLVIHEERDGVHPLDAELRTLGYVKRTVAVAVLGKDVRVVAKETQTFGPYVVYTHPNWDRKPIDAASSESEAMEVR